MELSADWTPACFTGYELVVEGIHWYNKENDEALNNPRYVELWLPITKKETILPLAVSNARGGLFVFAATSRGSQLFE